MTTAALPATALPTITPADEGFGADVTGIDLSQPLEAAQVEAIREAWYRHLVLRFRGQQLTDEQLIAFSARLGTLDRAPKRSATAVPVEGVAEYVLTISNVVENGKPIGELGDAEASWHQDMTYNESPPVGAVLYAIELPGQGGDTSFCDLYRAYETLEPLVKQQVESLSCIHDITLDSAGRPRKGYTPTTDPRQAQGALHPLVLRHPRTGRPHLYLGRRKWAYIPGLTLEESEALLDAIWAHCTRPEFHWTQRWEVGDLILWDNRCTMHRRDGFPADSRRVLHRTQLRNDDPRPTNH